MTCLSCLPEEEALVAEEGCLDGEVFTYCESEFCGGMCEYIGKCYCECHKQEQAVKGGDHGEV